MASPYFIKPASAASPGVHPGRKLLKSLSCCCSISEEIHHPVDVVIFSDFSEFAQGWYFKDHLLKSGVSGLAVMRERRNSRQEKVILSNTNVEVT